jgi:vanillate O-demethylase monooxygenase subunit
MNACQERIRPTDLPFLTDFWYVAGWRSEFESVGPHARTIIDQPIVLYRDRKNKLVALADRCAHRWAPLSLGRVEGDTLRCMYHGIRFGPDGACVAIPEQDVIPPKMCVRAYPVIERNKLVWVWMGSPDLADASLVPDLAALDQDGRKISFGSLDYKANYALIADNLLDLSHIGFLHENTAGRPVASGNLARACYLPGGSEAKTIDHGVRVESWVSGPAARNVLLPAAVPDGDLWTRTDFLVPGIFISEDRMYPYGVAERSGFRVPDPNIAALSDAISVQAVTPVSDRKTRYFYSFSPGADDVPASEFEAMWTVVKDTFAEDLKMIEAQQIIIDEHPAHQMAGIAADRGFVLFRKMVSRLAAEQSQTGGIGAI